MVYLFLNQTRIAHVKDTVRVNPNLNFHLLRTSFSCRSDLHYNKYILIINSSTQFIFKRNSFIELVNKILTYWFQKLQYDWLDRGQVQSTPLSHRTPLTCRRLTSCWRGQRGSWGTPPSPHSPPCWLRSTPTWSGRVGCQLRRILEPWKEKQMYMQKWILFRTNHFLIYLSVDFLLLKI